MQPVAVRKRLASAVCILGSAATFMLEHGAGIPKIPLIWVHMLMCWVLLFHFAAPGSSFKVDGHRPRILHKLQEFGVHPDSGPKLFEDFFVFWGNCFCFCAFAWSEGTGGRDGGREGGGFFLKKH